MKGTPAEGPGKLVVYDVAGAKVGEAAPSGTRPSPSRCRCSSTRTARLYVGRHWVEVK